MVTWGPATILTSVHPLRVEPYWKTSVVSPTDSVRRLKVKTKLLPEASNCGTTDASDALGLRLRTYSRRLFAPSLSASPAAVLSAPGAKVYPARAAQIFFCKSV